MTFRAVTRKFPGHPTRHFRHQRVTAVLLIPLSAWMLMFLNKAMSVPYADMLSWLVSPLNAGAIALWAIAVMYHTALGLQVVLEDYVSTIPVRRAAIYASNTFFIILAIAALAAIGFILYTEGNYGVCL